MINREVIFSLNGWTLENALSQADPDLQHLTMRHACKPFEEGLPLFITKVFVYPESAQACWRCKVPIPEGIIALYVLHEWDK